MRTFVVLTVSAILGAQQAIAADTPDFYFGVHISKEKDTGKDVSGQYVERLGHTPAMIMEFAKINAGGFINAPDDPNPFWPMGFFNDVKDNRPNAVPVLTLEPMEGLDVMTQDSYKTIAEAIAEYPGQTIIRFAHECNGDWYPWSTSPPETYVQHFIWMSQALKNSKANSQIMWSPNIESSTMKYTYEQVWPGPDNVDLIGISFYSKNIHDSDTMADYLGQLTGKVSDIEGGGTNFYADYIVKYQKPFILSETSAATRDMSPEDELKWKMDWLNQLYSAETISQLGPYYKGVLWFEADKVDEDTGVLLHYGLMNREELWEKFAGYFNGLPFLKFAEDLGDKGLQLTPGGASSPPPPSDNGDDINGAAPEPQGNGENGGNDGTVDDGGNDDNADNGGIDDNADNGSGNGDNGGDGSHANNGDGEHDGENGGKPSGGNGDGGNKQQGAGGDGGSTLSTISGHIGGGHAPIGTNGGQSVKVPAPAPVAAEPEVEAATIDPPPQVQQQVQAAAPSQTTPVLPPAPAPPVAQPATPTPPPPPPSPTDPNGTLLDPQGQAPGSSSNPYLMYSDASSCRPDSHAASMVLLVAALSSLLLWSA